MSSEDLIHLRSTGDALLAHFARPADVLSRSYAPGKWSARALLIHLTDTEGVILDRLRRTLADEKPLLWSYDENRWHDRLSTDRRSLDTARALFTATRAAIIELVQLAHPDDFARRAVHSENGQRTFAQLVAMAHAHTAHHLQQLDAIAAGRTWQPRMATYHGTQPD